MCCRQANEKEEMIIQTVKNLNLTNDEFNAMIWLAKWDIGTVANICSVISKAMDFGRPLSEILAEKRRNSK